MVLHWHQLPREVAESLFLEVIKNHEDVALRYMIISHGGDELMVGLHGVTGLFQS